MSAMLTLGYPLGKWGVAANRLPVQDVSAQNRWKAPFGVEVPQQLWPPQDKRGYSNQRAVPRRQSADLGESL